VQNHARTLTPRHRTSMRQQEPSPSRGDQEEGSPFQEIDALAMMMVWRYHSHPSQSRTHPKSGPFQIPFSERESCETQSLDGTLRVASSVYQKMGQSTRRDVAQGANPEEAREQASLLPRSPSNRRTAKLQ